LIPYHPFFLLESAMVFVEEAMDFDRGYIEAARRIVWVGKLVFDVYILVIWVEGRRYDRLMVGVVEANRRRGACGSATGREGLVRESEAAEVVKKDEEEEVEQR
jgi:hypothetical protein